MAIRLHHSDAAAFAHTVPEAALAAPVKAVDSSARQANIGLSGTVLGLALTKEGQEHWAQRFAQVDGVRGVPVRSYETRPYGAAIDAPTDGAAEALADLAAGVAHELNNPLSVITGRTAELRSQ